jgi:Tol biopolymer transport system component
MRMRTLLTALAGFTSLWRLALLAAAVAIALAAVAGSAEGKASGSNGQIVFSRYDPSIGDTVSYTANPDGSHLQPLFPGMQTAAPHWSPNGSELALVAGLNNPCPPCAGSTIILNPDTGSYRVLSPPDPNLGTGCPIWSPDAKLFACDGGSEDGSRNGIYTIQTSDGEGLTQITSNPGGEDVPIDYSPDGSQLVFGRLGQDHACGHANALYVVNADGSDLHQITPGGFCDDDGSWSPDGTKIVFEHFGSLYIVHPNGTGLKKLPLRTGSATTAFSAFDASWSPDGSKLIFSLNTKTAAGSGQEGIATANADGSNVQQATIAPPGSRDSSADWGSHALIAP